MQVDRVEKDADAAVVVNVAIGNQHVAIAIGEMNAVSALANEHLMKRWLHDAFDADAVGLGVLADDLDAGDDRHAFAAPLVVHEVRRIGGAAMRADEVERGAGAAHQNSRGPIGAVDRQPAVHLKGNLNRTRDEIIAAREVQRAVAFLDGVLDGLGVVGFAVAASAEIANAGHGSPFLEMIRA